MADQSPESPPRRAATPSEIAAWVVAAVSLVAVLWLHLLPALLAGLLVYEVVHVAVPRLQQRLSTPAARAVAVSVLATLVGGLVAALVLYAVSFFRGEGALTALLNKLAQVINQARVSLPPSIAEALPTTPDSVKAAAVRWLQTHAKAVQSAGAELGRTLAHVLVGLVVGGMVSLLDVRPHHFDRPLSAALVGRLAIFGNAFRRIVFAQVRISAINTGFTALFLAVGMPLFGEPLPFIGTLVAVTFVAGLLPVVGNLISNSVVVVVGLSASLGVAVACLVFLMVIHKLEYFLNARIVGSQIRAGAWELLVAMVVMEAAFGAAGMVAAPIYYAYLKEELSARGLV